MGEAFLLGVLAIASLSYFAWKVRQRLVGLASAPGRLRSDDLGVRLERVFREVLLQSRVIRDRPATGMLHALVMWGFLVFSWVSLEHLAVGFTGLENATRDDSWYGGFAAVWAALVLIGILGLAVRRFIFQPKALGKVSAGSGIVAALIVALMATYLAGWGGFEAGSAPWRINWRLHTLSLFAMLWVIPNSKHLHLFLGPFNVFFRGSDLTSPTRALREDDDDDLGLATFADLSKKDILDVNACVECGRCTDVCPPNQTGGSLNPKEVILQMQRGLLSRAGGDAHVAGTGAEVRAGEAWVTEDDLLQCLTCGACEQACPVGIEHVGAKIVDLRRGLVSEGRTNSNKLADLFRTMERSPHNAWGAPLATRTKLIESSAFPIFDGSQEWLLWLGCGCSYDPHGNDVARAMAKLLQAAGVSWGALKRETCCGDLARRTGNEYLYMEMSNKAMASILEVDVKKVVTCDPHCCRTFAVDYEQNEGWRKAGIEVLHHTELLERLSPRLSLASVAQGSTTYHDPCYLARGRGVTRQPRQLLQAAGVPLAEMEQREMRTSCCGAGGGQLFIADDSQGFDRPRINHGRFEQAVKTGATTVAVACPYCAIMLDDAAGHANRKDVHIVDIAELLASRLTA
jgi:Fe-S oxidoreductase